MTIDLFGLKGNEQLQQYWEEMIKLFDSALQKFEAIKTDLILLCSCYEMPRELTNSKPKV